MLFVSDRSIMKFSEQREDISRRRKKNALSRTTETYERDKEGMGYG